MGLHPDGQLSFILGMSAPRFVGPHPPQSLLSSVIIRYQFFALAF